MGPTGRNGRCSRRSQARRRYPIRGYLPSLSARSDDSGTLAHGTFVREQDGQGFTFESAQVTNIVWMIRAEISSIMKMGGREEDHRPLVLVTGASGSIGTAIVSRLGDRGCLVVTADRSQLPVDASDGVAAHLLVDLTIDSDVGIAFERIARIGPLRHVIAVAGGGDTEELMSSDQPTEPIEVFSRCVQNNLHTAFIAIRQAVPLLRLSAGDRSITLVGSINAYGGYGAPGYSAAKAGLSGLASSMASPLGADGIRINCVALGTVDTANLHRLARERGRPLDLAAIGARAPLGRVLTPQDAATALTNVALDLAGLTGATLILDNGQTLIR